MIYVFIIFMVVTGYYTLTYGISLIREDKNRLGGVAALVFAVVGTIAPIVVMIINR